MIQKHVFAEKYSIFTAKNKNDIQVSGHHHSNFKAIFLNYILFIFHVEKPINPVFIGVRGKKRDVYIISYIIPPRWLNILK